MATVGQQLLTPETGWQRYEDTNSMIGYIGNNWSKNQSYDTISTIDSEIQLKFYGTKFRYLIYGWSNRCQVKITIDGENCGTIVGSAYSSPNTIAFEKTNLSLKVHVVTLERVDSGVMSLDAIDIDSTGELKPFNYIIGKYLIKQNSNYYTIKSTNYDSTTTHNFIPLTLSGGTIPNKSDIETFGFDDLSVLTNSMIVNTDTFIPISKFDNTAELKLYKQV